MATKPEIAKQLGILIRECRKEAGINQEKLGLAVLEKKEKDAKACQAWISRLELGTTANLSEKKLNKIAKVVGVVPEPFIQLWKDYKQADDAPAEVSVKKSKGKSTLDAKIANINKIWPEFDEMFAALASLAKLNHKSEMLLGVIEPFIEKQKRLATGGKEKIKRKKQA